MEETELEPLKANKGKQEAFLSCNADVAIFGGAAGGGKSYSLILYPIYFFDIPKWTGIIFRRITSEITRPGSMWDEAVDTYTKYMKNLRIRGKPEYSIESNMGAKLSFSHLEYDSDCYSHKGGQYCFVGMDELTSFTEFQFTYMLSRNRSLCSAKPIFRGTCNPETNHWLKDHWLQWWIDIETGLPIEKRCGKSRYFTREENKIIWVDKNWHHPQDKKIGPKSITFIPAKVDDNPKLLEKNPQYKATLYGLPKVERQKLLDGNWNARAEDGMFDQNWIKVIEPEELPKNLTFVRYWDRACTIKDEKNPNPDNTAGALVALHGGNLYIKDMQCFKATPAGNEINIKNTANIDGRDVVIGLEQEPASSGKDVIWNYKNRILKDFIVKEDSPSGDKTQRAQSWCAMAEQGHVYIVRGNWNRQFLDEVATFPKPESKRDQVDSVSGAYKLLTQSFRVLPDYNKFHYIDVNLPPHGIQYLTLYQSKDMKICGLCVFWDYLDKILYIHNEINLLNPTVPALIKEIRDKSNNPMILGNETLFKVGENIAMLLVQAGIIITQNGLFNINGAIMKISELLVNQKIKVARTCIETDRQIREWVKENDKVMEDRFGLCMGLCMVVSLLQEQQKLNDPPERLPYDKHNREIREVLHGVPQQSFNIAPEGYNKARRKSWLL